MTQYIIAPILSGFNETICGWPCWFLIVLSLVLHAFFELAGIALLKARTARILELKEQRYYGAKSASRILNHSERFILSCQFWSFLTAFLAGSIAVSFIFPAMAGSWVEDQFSPLAFWSFAAFYLLVPLIIFAAAFVLLQLSKAVAYARPNRVLCSISLPLIIFELLSSWLVIILNVLSEWIIKVLRLKTASERDFVVSVEEISEIVDRSTKAGKLEEEEHEMIKSALEFSETIASEIMTPRKDVIAVPIDSDLQSIITVFKNEGHTRILIFGQNLDDFKGIINAKDFVPLAAENPNSEFNLIDYVRQVPAISGSLPIQDAMKLMRRQSAHFAVVLDEHGGLDGIITIEDIVEQVVGDIFDEYDLPEEEMLIEQTKTGDLLLDGGALIDDLNSEYNLNLPEGEYDTIAGFMIHALGKIPQQGEVYLYNGFKLLAEEVANHRVSQVRLIFVEK